MPWSSRVLRKQNVPLAVRLLTRINHHLDLKNIVNAPETKDKNIHLCTIETS